MLVVGKNILCFMFVFSVVWKKDNMVLEDTELYHFDKYEDTYCFEVKDSDVVDAGVYTCVATNEVGEVTVDIPLTVNGKWLSDKIRRSVL